MAIQSSTECLGQVVFPITAQTIVKSANNAGVQLFVASENKVKIAAATNAVLRWLGKREVDAKGFNAASNINEQPVGTMETKLGAQNRITHLKKLAVDSAKENTLQIYVSMENGIMPEVVDDVRNRQEFYDDEHKKTWVDRCFVIVQVYHKGREYEGSSFSEGVTTPLKAVKAAEASNWQKTCGSFIEEMYGFNAKDWHGQMAGVGRQKLMEEAIFHALNGN